MKNTIKGFFFKTTSRFNGKPVVVIFTGFSTKSHNVKTGKMIQSWILSDEANPFATSKARKDYGICGDCPQRHSLGGKCYVNLLHGPYAVYRSYKKGNYVALDLNNPAHTAMFKNQLVRLGSYGDSFAIPISFWKEFFEKTETKSVTNYTHAWKRPEAQDLKAFTMASVDNEKDVELAKSLGWRYFRSKSFSEPKLKNEFICPASAEKGKKLTCEECLSCNGMTNKNMKDVVITLHGSWVKKAEKFAA